MTTANPLMAKEKFLYAGVPCTPNWCLSISRRRAVTAQHIRSIGN